MITLTLWHWLALAALLGVGELFTFTSYMLCMALAALITGLTLAALPMLSLAAQGILFAVATLIIAGSWVYYTKHFFNKSDKPLLNNRAEQLVGRLFTLETPIVNGVGKALIDGIIWKITGIDTPAGVQMKITGVKGFILLVEVATEN